MRPRRSAAAAAAPAGYRAPDRLARVIAGVGTKSAVAALLDVSRSQPGRWLSGQDAMSPVHAARLADLDALLSQAYKVMTPDQALLWLDSANPFLGGATPVTVFRRWGLSRVIPALEAVEQGAYL